jgi:hypothetical protein
MNISLSNGSFISVDEKCKSLIVNEFQAMLFAKNGYVFPKPEQVTSELNTRIKLLEDKNIKVNGPVLYDDLKKYIENEYVKINKK